MLSAAYRVAPYRLVLVISFTKWANLYYFWVIYRVYVIRLNIKNTHYKNVMHIPFYLFTNVKNILRLFKNDLRNVITKRMVL